MCKVCKVFSLLIFVLFLTGFTKVDTNLKSEYNKINNDTIITSISGKFIGGMNINIFKKVNASAYVDKIMETLYEISDYKFQADKYVYIMAKDVNTSCYTGGYSPDTCAYYLGNAEDNNKDCPAYWLNYVFQIVKYSSLALVIVMNMVSLVTAIMKENMVSNVLKKCVIRLLICIVILILPTMIDIVGSLFGLDGLLCGIK